MLKWKMEMAVVVAVMIAVFPEPSPAQSRQRAYLGDSDIVAGNVTRLYFDSLTLSAKQRSEADRIIKRAFRGQFKPVDGATADRIKVHEALNVVRDSALRALLRTKAEREKFDRNVAAAEGTGRPRAVRP